MIIKKALVALLAVGVVLFSGCSSDKDNPAPEGKCPIDELELPSSEEPIVGGSTVKIKGKGFTNESEIWLVSTLTGQEAVKAKIIEFTSNYIKFAVPDKTDGENSIVLKEADKEYVLGKLTFRAKPTEPEPEPEPESETLYAIKHCGDGNVGIYKIEDGNLISQHIVDNIGASNEVTSVITIGSKAYIVVTNVENRNTSKEKKMFDRLICYDTENGAEIDIPILSKNTIIAFGSIDNKLHTMRYNETKGSFTLLLIHDAVEEKMWETSISECEGLPYEEEDFIFNFDKIKKRILLLGTLGVDYTYISSIPTMRGEYNSGYILSHTPKEISYLAADNDLYEFSRGQMQEIPGTKMLLFDSEKFIGSLPFVFFPYPVRSSAYMPISKKIYLTDNKNNLFSYNLDNKETKDEKIKLDEEFFETILFSVAI